MPIKDYPFISVTSEGKITVKRKGARAWLWIKVLNPHNPYFKKAGIITLGLLDTGADCCTFPADMARQLGHDLQSVSPIEAGTAKGITYSFPHTTRIEILDVDSNGQPCNKILYTIPDTPIYFTQGLKHCLLGRKEFLNRFVVKIDYPRQVFSIRFPQPKTKKKKRRRRQV